MGLRYTVDKHGMGYVHLSRPSQFLSAVETVSVGSRFHIDLDYLGRPIGVEIFGAKAESVLADALEALATWIHSSENGSPA